MRGRESIFLFGIVQIAQSMSLGELPGVFDDYFLTSSKTAEAQDVSILVAPLRRADGFQHGSEVQNTNLQLQKTK